MGVVVVDEVADAGVASEVVVVVVEAMPPRSGSESVRVEEGGIERLSSVGVGSADENSAVEVVGVGMRCLPARCRRRFIGGIDVRSERSSRRVAMGVEEGRINGIAERRLVGWFLLEWTGREAYFRR